MASWVSSLLVSAVLAFFLKCASSSTSFSRFSNSPFLLRAVFSWFGRFCSERAFFLQGSSLSFSSLASVLRAFLWAGSFLSVVSSLPRFSLWPLGLSRRLVFSRASEASLKPSSLCSSVFCPVALSLCFFALVSVLGGFFSSWKNFSRLRHSCSTSLACARSACVALRNFRLSCASLDLGPLFL